MGTTFPHRRFKTSEHQLSLQEVGLGNGGTLTLKVKF